VRIRGNLAAKTPQRICRADKVAMGNSSGNKLRLAPQETGRSTHSNPRLELPSRKCRSSITRASVSPMGDATSRAHCPPPESDRERRSFAKQPCASHSAAFVLLVRMARQPEGGSHRRPFDPRDKDIVMNAKKGPAKGDGRACPRPCGRASCGRHGCITRSTRGRGSQQFGGTTPCKANCPCI
jgi:hypothetical protein